MEAIGTSSRIGLFVRSLGPGILLASAAIGGSHLVASTQAGAFFGWQLVGLILLVNLFKYPFFRASVQYTMGTGLTLVEGYAQLGLRYLWMFMCLNVIAAVVNSAALIIFSASLLSYFLPFNLSITTLSCIIVFTCLVILLQGHYKALNSISKFIVAILTLATLLAVVIAFTNPVEQIPNFESPSPWTLATIGFLVLTMGWMPAPIEVTTMTSAWLKQQIAQQQVTPQSALRDFNVGYIGTALLAVVFIALGALMLHGSGKEFAISGVGFSNQLIGLYASTIGEWSRYLIAVIAFMCIFGSTITVMDGSARVISDSQSLLRAKSIGNVKETSFILLMVSLAGLGIVVFWTSALGPMLNFAMILAFMTTPFFALLNYILVSKTDLPESLAMGRKLKWLSMIGLIYLFGFWLVFIWWKWLM